MAHVKRNSLPLPTTIALPDSPATPNATFTPSTPVPPSPVTSFSFSGTHPLPLNASNILLHNTQFTAQTSSSTHAGGIQPSASFFKPKKPVEYASGAQRYPPPPPHLGLPDGDDEHGVETEEPAKPRASTHLTIPHPLSPSFSTGTLSPSLSQHHHHHSNHSLDDMREHEDRGGVPPSDTEDDLKRRTVNPKLSREPLIDAAHTPNPTLTIPGTPSRIPPINTGILSIGGNHNFNNPGPSRPVLSIRGSGAQSPTSAGSSNRFGLMRTVFGGASQSSSTTPHSASTNSPATPRRGSQDAVNTTRASRRTSLDVSITTKKSKRNSLVYKPRLTFESLRRSSASRDETGSRRESYVATEDETEDERGLHNRSHSHGRHPFAAENGDGIPLTPTKAGARKASKGRGSRSGHGHGRSDDGHTHTPRKDRARAKRSSFGASSRSRSRSVGSSRSSLSDEEDVSSLEGGGASTPTPGLFNPTPPPLGRGEYPKMKTPLRYPLDPSLIPVEKLEQELATRARGRKRSRRGILGNVRLGKGKGGALEKQTGLPTTTGGTTLSSQSSKQHIRAAVDIAEDDENGGDEKPGRLVKRYELHPSRNGFFFGGRIMTGGDSPWAFIMALCVLFGIAGVWFGTTGVWWWKEAGRARVSISLGDPPPVGLGNTGLNLRPGLSSLDKLGVEGRDWTWVTVNANARRAGKAIVIVCAYLTAMVISSMFMTAFSDPGVLPRGLDLNPPFPANSPSDGGLRAPMPRDLKVREDVVRVKYCPTCKTYRPPRASHCKMCDNCVDGCDHHCQWVNNCVGSRNYTTFFVLLMSATLTAILVIVTAALHLYYLTVWQRYTFKEALSQGAGSAVGFCLAIVVIWPVGALLSYHLRVSLFYDYLLSPSSVRPAFNPYIPFPDYERSRILQNLESCRFLTRACLSSHLVSPRTRLIGGGKA
ncbi:hypothetical protein D9611_005011 [Ephemerocybe angulata]|uniref:Palmitoyltransferase DHHC domain-containing protein n=1 Tax=Ephemerocybe angulata TaxID=980116 RepID=A0A8H5B3L3_9AGAR|nr:hypothetical protein D9611_005011 [Tulosesus angulatus]